ncbi:hypothetical protein Peur_023552 [Populus x canadensis]
MFTLQASQILRQQVFNNAVVKSNVITKNCILGMGNGQPNRLESLRISMRKAGDEVKGTSLASDTFFPIAWNDTVEKVCEASIGVVTEHGGSIRNKDTIECYNSI